MDYRPTYFRYDNWFLHRVAGHAWAFRGGWKGLQLHPMKNCEAVKK